jgi:hypothetical protein
MRPAATKTRTDARHRPEAAIGRARQRELRTLVLILSATNKDDNQKSTGVPPPGGLPPVFSRAMMVAGKPFELPTARMKHEVTSGRRSNVPS